MPAIPEQNRPLDFEILLDALNDKDIIYIGEYHQIPEILSFQIDIISGLIHRGFQPSLGLEIFNVLQQKILDYYIAGILPLPQLLSLYEMGPEGFDLNHYLKIVELAVKNRLKVIALNIPRNIALAVARYGLDEQELTVSHLKAKDIANYSKAYREVIGSFFRKYPHEEITEENFILGQSIKDEMMAESIVPIFQSGR